MSTHLVVPAEVWEDNDEGVVTTWMYDDGARVTAGTVVVEVMVGKSQHEIVAPADGILRVTAKVDDIIDRSSMLGTVEPS